MSQYLLMISMDGEGAVPCLPADENALGLNCDGISWLDEAMVCIRRDAMNELIVHCECDMPVTLERSGRCLTLGSREVRLLPKDVICFGGHRFEIVSVRRYQDAKRRFSSRHAMLSAAAAFALVAVPACQPKNAGYPETPPQVETRTGGDVTPMTPEEEAELQKLKEENAKAEAELKAELEDIEAQNVNKHPMGDVVAVRPEPEADVKEDAPPIVPPMPAGLPPRPEPPAPQTLPSPEIVPDCGCKDGEKCDCSETGKPCGCSKDMGEPVKIPEVKIEHRGKFVMPVETDE
ncbi:MAG: hypothetical protein IKY83_06810 [Proteobacteria bacterium]|nr:hypothetical protein [Pseudomonadota bacterium]